MKEKTFTGKELEYALNEESFGNLQSNLTLIGMVKKSAQKGYIGFTQFGCDSWIDIPIEMIERAEYLENRKCKDHSHPIMEVTLKQSENSELRVLIALLHQKTQPRNDSDSYRKHSNCGCESGGIATSRRFAPNAPNISDNASACLQTCIFFNCSYDSNGGIDAGCFLHCLQLCSVFNVSDGQALTPNHAKYFR